MRQVTKCAGELCRILLLTIWSGAHAAEPNSQVEASHLFSKGRIEMGTGSSVMFSPFVASNSRPTFNYATGFVQGGYMLTEPKGPGVLFGNTELVGEIFGGGFFLGRGTYLAGSTLWLRYNFLLQGWRVTPYAQLGAGALFADIDKEIGSQTFNFNLDAAVGFRYLLTRNLSLNLEYRYQHISNANTGVHNLGLNAQGPVIGLSWAF